MHRRCERIRRRIERGNARFSAEAESLPRERSIVGEAFTGRSADHSANVESNMCFAIRYV